MKVLFEGGRGGGSLDFADLLADFYNKKQIKALF